MQTETGEQYVPVFVVDSLESAGSNDADAGTDMNTDFHQNMNPGAEGELNLTPEDTGAETGTNANEEAGSN